MVVAVEFFCFLGVSIGRYVFEQFTRETNLKKKRSVILCADQNAINFTVLTLIATLLVMVRKMHG